MTKSLPKMSLREGFFVLYVGCNASILDGIILKIVIYFFLTSPLIMKMANRKTSKKKMI